MSQIEQRYGYAPFAEAVAKLNAEIQARINAGTLADAAALDEIKPTPFPIGRYEGCLYEKLPKPGAVRISFDEGKESPLSYTQVFDLGREFAFDRSIAREGVLNLIVREPKDGNTDIEIEIVEAGSNIEARR
jgi:hypothetical protein